ncbi:hypothetical protein ATANTOWER_011805, partial [Ataeniobius toweri]|nr:hypothetical protein [Ataeniobius toweri]
MLAGSILQFEELRERPAGRCPDITGSTWHSVATQCEKQDGADPRISAPLEHQLLQPVLTHSTSPLHKGSRMDEQRCTFPPTLK